MISRVNRIMAEVESRANARSGELLVRLAEKIAARGAILPCQRHGQLHWDYVASKILKTKLKRRYLNCTDHQTEMEYFEAIKKTERLRAQRRSILCTCLIKRK